MAETVPIRNTLKSRSHALIAARDGNLATLNSILENASDDFKNELLGSVVKLQNQVCNPLMLATAFDHTAIVELLGRKYKHYVDVNQECTVYHKECLRHRVTALHCAASNGNMDIAKLLVEELGANINHKAQYNINPVREACQGGHLDMVKYLISCGGDPFLRHSYDQSTCLTVSISSGHFDVAEFLLENGMDPNFQTADTGMTALHYACRQTSPDLVKTLIKKGASVNLKDNRGLSPIDHAVETCNIKITDLFYFDEIVTLPQEVKIRMYELLGASLILDGSYYMGHAKLKHAMRERFEYTSEMHYKSGLIMVEKDSLIYGNRMESFTAEELEELADDEEGLKQEALLVMERILGENQYLKPEDVIKNFSERATNYESEGRYMDSLTILLKVLHIQEKMKKSNWQVTEQFVTLFAHMQVDSYILDPAVLSEVFNQCLTDMEQEWLKYQYVDFEPVRQEAMDTLVKQVRNVLGLIAVMKCLCTEEDDSNLHIAVARYVSRFVNMEVVLDAMHGASVLHIACSGASSRYSQLRSPNAEVVELLLEKGADVNATDKDGNTPLHVLASYNGSEDDAILEIARLFIMSNAHLDARNSEGLRPLDLANPVIIEELKIHTKKVPLKCMAAQVVKLCLQNYTDLLPPKLCKFVQQH